MRIDFGLAVPATVLLALVLTGIARKLALSVGLLDVPNERSSHTRVTPRGGGVALVIAASVAVVVYALMGAIGWKLTMAVVGGGLVIAAVGLADDWRPLNAIVRLSIHFATALVAVTLLGGLPPLQIGERAVSLGWGGTGLAVMGVVWSLNLFNFMDGIDGIAASEAAFVGFGATLVAGIAGAPNGVPLGASIVAAACCGFLFWNWPPARIFMGDTGSGYLGFVISILAIDAARTNSAALWKWLILGGAFFVDATVTLVRRLSRGERVFQAHRSHAYQWLARRWGSHLKATMAFIGVNVAWLLPCAFFAARYPQCAAWIALVALTPLSGLAVVAGAGRREQSRATVVERQKAGG